MPLITQNDFLNPLFSLNPFVMGVLVLVFGVTSLVLYASSIGKLQSLLKPSFIIGDFILLPLIGIAINYFYQNIQTSTKLVNNTWILVFTGLLAILLLVISTMRFNLLKPLFLPHLLFVLLMNYIILTFLLKGFLQLISIGSANLWVIYIFVLVSSILVNILGIIYPKTF